MRNDHWLLSGGCFDRVFSVLPLVATVGTLRRKKILFQLERRIRSCVFSKAHESLLTRQRSSEANFLSMPISRSQLWCRSFVRAGGSWLNTLNADGNGLGRPDSRPSLTRM